jgi:hypothetical protein
MKYGYSVASIMVGGDDVNNSHVVILRTAFIIDHGFISNSPAQAAHWGRLPKNAEKAAIHPPTSLTVTTRVK